MRALLFITGLLLPSIGWGESEDCSSVATDFARLVDRASTSVAGKVISKEQALARIEELAQVEVKAIFPETKSVRTGRRVTETRVRDDAASIDRYKRHFDQFWEMRVASGQIPSWKLKEYRDWLKTQSKGSTPSAYPELNDDAFVSENLDQWLK